MQENREWHAAVLEGTSLDEGAANLAEGGLLTLAGSAAAIRAWAVAGAEEAGRRVVLLDLDGWEPESSSRESFLRFLAAIGRIQLSEDEALDGARDGDSLGLFGAAGLSLFGPASAARDREELVAEILARCAEQALMLVVPDGDGLPQPLRYAVLEAQAAAGDGLMIVDVTRGWRESQGRIEPRLGESRDPAREALSDLYGRRVLEALAILDQPFPLEPLLDLLVPDVALHEQTIDLVDDLLVDELEWVEDLGFIHPAFEYSLYRVKDPLFAARLLAGVDLVPRAEALLAFLRQRLEPRARVTTSVLARLAEVAGRGEQARRLELRLRWWALPDDLELDLKAAIAKEEIKDAELLRLGADGVLGPKTRLAILTVHEAAGLLPDAEGLFHLHRARALGDAGDVIEAIEAITRSLEWHQLNQGRQVEAFLETQMTAARLLAVAGEVRPARDQLLHARQLAAEILEPDDPRHAVLAADLGRVLIAVGELRAAKEPLEEALERTVKRFGPHHMQTLSARNNLSALLLDVGELESARAHLMTAIRSAKEAGLPIALRLGLWRNVQTAISRLGGDGEGIDQLLDAARSQLPGASELGPLASLAGAVPDPALGELEQMLGLGPDFAPEDFEAGEARLLEALDAESE